MSFAYLREYKSFRIRSHQSSDFAVVVDRHQELYAREHGWPAGNFEKLCEGEIALFEANYNPQWECCWIAERSDGSTIAPMDQSQIADDRSGQGGNDSLKATQNSHETHLVAEAEALDADLMRPISDTASKEANDKVQNRSRIYAPNFLGCIMLWLDRGEVHMQDKDGNRAANSSKDTIEPISLDQTDVQPSTKAFPKPTASERPSEEDAAPASAMEHQRQPKARLRMLLVEPSARGMGVGTALIKTCVESARERGYGEMSLWTTSGLVAARKLYAKQGFEKIREHKTDIMGVDLIGEEWFMSL